MAACTWPSNSDLSQTLKKATYWKVSNYYQDKVFQQLSKGYSVEIIDTRLESEISPYIPPAYKWRILIGRISWRTPAVSPREASGEAAKTIQNSHSSPASYAG